MDWYLYIMEFLNKFNQKHYKNYLSIVNKTLGNYNNVHTWVKSLGTADILLWLKMITFFEKNNAAFFNESSTIVTITIRLFILELDVEDAKLTNKEIKQLVTRLQKVLATELAYRKDIINKTPKYTILKDVEY